MPIFCSNVNQAYQENLVPITQHNGASIVPDNLVIALKRVAEGPENGVLRELTSLVAIPVVIFSGTIVLTLHSMEGT